MNADLQSNLDALRDAVAGFGRFRKRWSVLHGLALAVLALPGALLVWFALDWALRLPAWPLFVLFVLAAGAGTIAAAWWLAKPLTRRIRPENEALVIESLHGQLDNQIIGSLQLGHEIAEAKTTGKKPGYSGEFVTALLGQTTERVSNLQVHKLVDLSFARRAIAGACIVIVAIALSLVYASGAVQDRIQRLRDAYATVLDTLFPIELLVTPGDIAVVRGRPLRLSVEARGARRPGVLLHRTDLKTKKIETVPLMLHQQNAGFDIAKTAESFTYEFEYGGRRTPAHKVLVDDLPEISAINYELAPPAYTGQPARTLTGRLPRVAGLAGTSALVSFASTTELHPELCHVEWADGSKQTLSVSGRFGHFSFTLAKPDRATIRLTGALGKGFEMERPLSFELAVQRDEPPAVRVLLKNRQVTMLAEEAAAFAVDWVAEDDYGVAEVNLDYRIDTVDALLGRPTRENSVPRRIEPARDRAKGRFADMFKALTPPLQPGDRMTVVLTARDNNTETGPGAGKSLPIEIVVVRPDLSGFVEQNFGFGAASLLGGLQKIKRATDLLVEAPKTVRTEKTPPADKQPINVRAGQEPWPGGSTDAVADYFNLLSGGLK
jgi:hypothetical protein